MRQYSPFKYLCGNWKYFVPLHVLKYLTCLVLSHSLQILMNVQIKLSARMVAASTPMVPIPVNALMVTSCFLMGQSVLIWERRAASWSTMMGCALCRWGLQSLGWCAAAPWGLLGALTASHVQQRTQVRFKHLSFYFMVKEAAQGQKLIRNNSISFIFDAIS